MKYFNPNLSLPQILNVISKMEGTVEDRANTLKQWNRKDVHWFVDFMFNGEKDREGIVIPEFKKSSKPFGVNFMTLNSALPKINAAITNRTNKAVFDRNIKLVLESISADEADLLVNVLTGKTVENIPRAVFRRAFPSYFRNSEG